MSTTHTADEVRHSMKLYSGHGQSGIPDLCHNSIVSPEQVGRCRICGLSRQRITAYDTELGPVCSACEPRLIEGNLAAIGRITSRGFGPNAQINLTANHMGDPTDSLNLVYSTPGVCESLLAAIGYLQTQSQRLELAGVYTGETQESGESRDAGPSGYWPSALVYYVNPTGANQLRAKAYILTEVAETPNGMRSSTFIGAINYKSGLLTTTIRPRRFEHVPDGTLYGTNTYGEIPRVYGKAMFERVRST